jgi:hypothetical protein
MKATLRFPTSAIGLALVFAFLGNSAFAQRPRSRAAKMTICGDPTATCKSSTTFQPNDLPFRVPESWVVSDTEVFYAILLKSMPAEYDNCDVFIPETERLEAQSLFPRNKVFSSRCIDPENLFYTDESAPLKKRYLNENHRIMAVYAGATLATARRFLETVKATGKFPGANIRRMRTGFNGT